MASADFYQKQIVELDLNVWISTASSWREADDAIGSIYEQKRKLRGIKNRLKDEIDSIQDSFDNSIGRTLIKSIFGKGADHQRKIQEIETLKTVDNSIDDLSLQMDKTINEFKKFKVRLKETPPTIKSVPKNKKSPVKLNPDTKKRKLPSKNTQRPNYSKYISSTEWRTKAEEAKARAGNRCQTCNVSRAKEQLDAHHRTYERLGNELPEDITVLCRTCHQLFENNKKLPSKKLLFKDNKKLPNKASLSKDNKKLLNKTPQKGFCLRCKKSIALNPRIPYCKDCYKSWAKFKNKSYKEKYCHICGEENHTSFVRPACLVCFRDNKDKLEFPQAPKKRS